MTPLSENITALYERHAHAWAEERGSDLVLEKQWLDSFISLLPEGATILDVGCGSAEPIAKYLIEKGFEVSGVDASPTMISMCRSRFPDNQWIVADMRRLSLGRTFQGLIAWDSFFHLSHDAQRGMFPIFRQHLLAGAPLMFTSGPAHGEAIGTYGGEPLYHASLDAAEYRSLLAANGFAVVKHVTGDPECGGHTVWLAQLQQ